MKKCAALNRILGSKERRVWDRKDGSKADTFGDIEIPSIRNENTPSSLFVSNNNILLTVFVAFRKASKSDGCMLQKLHFTKNVSNNVKSI